MKKIKQNKIDNQAGLKKEEIGTGVAKVAKITKIIKKNAKNAEITTAIERLTTRGTKPMLKKDGTPRKLSNRKLDFNRGVVLKAIKRSGGFISSVAKNFDVSWATMNAFINNDKELLLAITNEKQVLLDIAENALIRKIMEGQDWAVKYYLSTQGKRRGYTTRFENETIGDNAIIELLQKQIKELTNIILSISEE